MNVERLKVLADMKPTLSDMKDRLAIASSGPGIGQAAIGEFSTGGSSPSDIDLLNQLIAICEQATIALSEASA